MRFMGALAATLALSSAAHAAAPMLGRSVSVYQSGFCRTHGCTLNVKAPIVQDGVRLEQRAYRLRDGVFLVSTRAAPLIGKRNPKTVLGAVKSVTLQGTYDQAAALGRVIASFAGHATQGRRVAFAFDFESKCRSARDVVNAYPFTVGGTTFTLQCNRFPTAQLLSVTLYRPDVRFFVGGTPWWNQFNIVLPAFCALSNARGALECPLF
jgi:hypothetical protein